MYLTVKQRETFLRQDESVPMHPELGPGHPLVVFGDHRFCAGKSLDVMRMPGPHMHSQVEINFVLQGQMTYWFDGRALVVTQGQLVFFWGMIPHQVTDVEEPTKFVCIYVPMALFLALPTRSLLRDAIFRGAVIEALDTKPYDQDIFLRWRNELLSADEQIEQMVRDELAARVRRLDREGWRDMRNLAATSALDAGHDADRVLHVETMAKYIAERATSNLSVKDVAATVNLHPNYAMALFKRGVGHTINQSIMRQRLDVAQSMLIATDQSVANVAYDCGFGSLSRFYEAFHQRFHTSPANFRRRLRTGTDDVVTRSISLQPVPL